MALALAVEHPEQSRAVAFITPQLWATKEFLSPFSAGERDSYEGYDEVQPELLAARLPGFVDWFARAIHPHPHSTRQIEETAAHALETDGATLLAATVGFEMYERDEALALARRIRCPVLVTQNGGQAFWPKDTSGPLAEASGPASTSSRAGPVVASRWPVAMNIVLREFFESVAVAERGSRGPHTPDIRCPRSPAPASAAPQPLRSAASRMGAAMASARSGSPAPCWTLASAR